jgi:very-short-patch-repair endonuclease
MTAVPAERRAPTWQEIAEEQNGVLDRRQARAAGLSEDAWQWRLDRGLWRAVLPGVVVCHSGEPTDRQRAWAAVRYAGAGAALSADAALLDLGMRLTAPEVLHVAIPENRIVVAQGFAATSAPYRVRPHRVRRLDELRHPARPLPVVRASSAVLHAAAWAPSDRAAEWRLAAAVQQRVVRVRDVRSALAALPRLRRRALVRAVLDDVEQGAHAGSELDFLALLRRNRLPLPDELQLRPRTRDVRYLDAVWKRQRVAAEIDGAHHMEVAAWDADVLRANAVVIGHRDDGLLLVRFTTGNLRHDEPVVVEQLGTLLG